MKRLSICLIIGLCCAVSIAAPAHDLDPLKSLQQVSGFPNIDAKRLMGGEILGQRGPLMNSPHGISSQICYAVRLTPAETVKRLQTWEPTRCESLKVYASSGLQIPCELKDFNSLHLDPGQRPVKWLLDKTQAITADNSGLNLTRSEAHELAGCAGKNPDPNRVSSCWAKLLFERATAFQNKGLTGVLPYETGEEPLSPAAQVRLMLQEQGRITREFAPILQKSGLMNDGALVSPLTPSYNWSLFEADRHATLNLGAVYQLAVGDHYQLLDFHYYVSGCYYTAATLYEIWPIRVGETTGSLVWRVDFLAAPSLRYTKGIERIAYGSVMIQEIKKEIRCFQNEIRTKP